VLQEPCFISVHSMAAKLEEGVQTHPPTTQGMKFALPVEVLVILAHLILLTKTLIIASGVAVRANYHPLRRRCTKFNRVLDL